jgi:U3 small nucleolar RNA-associated protein 7
MLIAGKKGRVAMLDWKKGRLGAEIHLKETLRDCSWLLNGLFR